MDARGELDRAVRLTGRGAWCTGWTTTLFGTSAESGARDGFGDTAQFSTPHGLTLHAAHALYVADTGNHLIRRVDLSTGALGDAAATQTLSALTHSTRGRTAVRGGRRRASVHPASHGGLCWGWCS